MITRNLVYAILLFLFYGFQYLLIPGVVLYPDMKGHSLGYRVLFYQISALCYISLVSFALCYMHIYTAASAWISFVVFPVCLRLFRDRRAILAASHQWMEGYNERKTYTESFKSRMRRYGNYLKPIVSLFYRNYLKGRLLQYLTCAIVVYLIYARFGYFHLTHYTYECSDEATHIYWVTSMLKGNAFPAGIYPHGMHFMVGGICIMFGLDVMRAWMSFGMVSMTIVFLSGFLFTEKIFRSKFAAAAGVILLIIGKGLYSDWTSLLGWVMPMELAMYAAFIMMYGLICWIEDYDKKSLLMFGMGVLGTTLVHVFATIAAFFVVVAFVLIFGIRMIREKRFHKFFLCGMLAVILAVAPYGVGLACGYQLEQSFNWGMNVISSGSTTDEDSLDEESISSEEADSAVSEEIPEEINSDTNDIPENENTEETLSFQDKINLLWTQIMDAMTGHITTGTRTNCGILFLCLFEGLYGFFGVLLSQKNKKESCHYAEILFAAASWFLVFTVLFLFARFGVMTIMAPVRACVFAGFLLIPLYAAPFGFIAGLVNRIGLRGKYVDEFAMMAVGMCSIVFAVWSGTPLYADLYYSFVLEEQDVRAEERMITEEEKDTWTVISTTNARLAILNDGYHYEITDLLLACRDKDELYIPTKDIFVVVEDKVTAVTSMLVDGSDFEKNIYDISTKAAASPLSDFIAVKNGTIDSKCYVNYNTRSGIMSHLYYWMEKIKKVYPNEVSIYTQDDTCTVYRITQDPYFLLNLSVDYSDVVEEALNSETAG